MDLARIVAEDLVLHWFEKLPVVTDCGCGSSGLNRQNHDRQEMACEPVQHFS